VDRSATASGKAAHKQTFRNAARRFVTVEATHPLRAVIPPVSTPDHSTLANRHYPKFNWKE